MQSVSSCVLDRVDPRSAEASASDMMSALARLQKHAELECEVDAEAPEWRRLADEFEDAAGQPFVQDKVSRLILRQQGNAVAGALVVIATLPGFSRGIASLRSGPFWRRRGKPADAGFYRAAIGALVHEYCVRRGHFLTVVPRFHPTFYVEEVRMLAEFGFTARAGEYDYYAPGSARISGAAIDGWRSIQRVIRR